MSQNLITNWHIEETLNYVFEEQFSGINLQDLPQTDEKIIILKEYCFEIILDRLEIYDEERDKCIDYLLQNQEFNQMFAGIYNYYLDLYNNK